MIFQGLTSTAVKKGGLYALDVNAVYKHSQMLVMPNTQIYGFPLCSLWLAVTPFLLYLQISSTLTVLDVLPSTKLVTSVKLPDYNSGKVIPFCVYSQFLVA